MTKRQFDSEIKENWGGPFMASDERENYRTRLLKRLGAREDYRERREKDSKTAGVPALSRGSRFSSPALYAPKWKGCSLMTLKGC